MPEELDTFRELPSIGQILQQRLAAKGVAANGPLPPPGTVDPYELMMARKQAALRGEPVKQPELPPVQKWPEEDVKALEDYCKKMGILGFATRMNPKIALMQLKQQMGDYSGVPLEDRIPEGYEKIGTQNPYGPNYPYSNAVRGVEKKQVLHG
jgi:hypothetical protein